ncbi:hypothetical protein HDU86_003274, partial [Geranomyces michiganensis]
VFQEKSAPIKLAANKTPLVSSLNELINQVNNTHDLNMFFSKVKNATVDALVLPLFDVIANLEYAEGKFQEDEATRKKRGRLNEALARLPGLHAIVEGLQKS